MKKKKVRPAATNLTIPERLPNSVVEFDSLIDRLMKAYGFTARNHVVATVATRIKHLPIDQSHATLDYFGACVIKNAAFQLADTLLNLVAHQESVQNCVAELTRNPNNAEPRDALMKGALQGSEYARKALKDLGIPLEEKCVLSVVPPVQDAQPNGSA
jgi:hypothetical protein